jgi:uncharacterized MAPEG superfamily protein
MASFYTTLGLRASPQTPIPNYAPFYLSLHFIFAYCVLAPRHLKQLYGLDHNVSPREDLTKYGDRAVSSGKITQKTLNMMKRNEAAQANSIENYVLFVGAMSMACFAGVEREKINAAGLIYTVARVAYGGFYIFAESLGWSFGRSAAWWVGNGSCLWLLWKAGGNLNKS